MIYLDNAATSFPKPEGVYAALDRFARTTLANPGRAGHKMALAAEHALDDARHRLNQFFNGKRPERWVFTLNGTDALNMAFKGVLNDGDHVVTTDLEHNSVSPAAAWHWREAGRITLTRVAADAAGTVDPDAVAAAITPKTRLVAMTHASNVLGTVQPDRGDRPRSPASATCSSSWTRPRPPASFRSTCRPRASTCSRSPATSRCSARPGPGALYVGPRAQLRPWREGGTGGDSSTPTQPTEFPYYLEGGTPNVLGVAGLVAGLDYVEERGLDAIHQHEVELCDRLRQALDENGRLRGLRPRRSGAPRRHGQLPLRSDAGRRTRRHPGPVVRHRRPARPALRPYIHRALGTFPDGLVRVSPGPFNTAADIDRLIAALKEVTGGI